MRTRSHAACERHRRQADAEPVPPGDPADDYPHQHQLIGGGDRGLRSQRYLELVHPVLGMELFDGNTRTRRGVGDIANETLVLEHACQPVLRPQVGGQPAAVGSDEHELHLVADQRVDARRRRACVRCGAALRDCSRGPVRRPDRRKRLAPKPIRRPRMRSAPRSMRIRWSPTTPVASPNTMPVWSMANTCQTGLAPSPGSANAPILRSGIVLACVSPAGLTTVPMRVATPSDSSWAMAAAARGLAADVTAPFCAP